jgi:hypothetical protein
LGGQRIDEEWQERGTNYAIKLVADRCRIDKGGDHLRDDIHIDKC